MNLDLLKAGYVFYLTKTERKLIGTYIKGTEFKVEGLYEVPSQYLEFFNLLGNILKTIDRTNTFAIYYNWESQKYVGEIRTEKYSGPYNEERYYDVTHRETSNNILEVLLTIDNNLERKKDEKGNKTKQLNSITENLTPEEIQMLIDYATELSSKPHNKIGPTKRKTFLC